MLLGFSKALRAMGGVRLGVYIRGKWAALLFVFVLMFYVMWYSLLAALWIVYGMVWIVVKPIAWIINRIRNRRAQAENAPQ